MFGEKCIGLICNDICIRIKLIRITCIVIKCILIKCIEIKYIRIKCPGIKYIGRKMILDAEINISEEKGVGMKCIGIK